MCNLCYFGISISHTLNVLQTRARFSEWIGVQSPMTSPLTSPAAMGSPSSLQHHPYTGNNASADASNGGGGGGGGGGGQTDSMSHGGTSTGGRPWATRVRGSSTGSGVVAKENEYDDGFGYDRSLFDLSFKSLCSSLCCEALNYVSRGPDHTVFRLLTSSHTPHDTHFKVSQHW